MKLILVLSFLLPLACNAEVYKCQKDGKTFFQDSPCAAEKGQSGTKIDIKYQSISDDPLAESLTEERRQKFDNLIAQRKVSVGMTEKMLQKSWGKPSKINVTIRSSGRSEQWIYGDGLNRDYVYVENGFVTSIQGAR